MTGLVLIKPGSTFDVSPETYEGYSGDINATQRKAFSDNTLNGYNSAIKHFKHWVGYDNPFPAHPRLILCYLAHFKHTLAPTTLSHRVAALSFYHRQHGWDDPTQDVGVKNLLKGYRSDRVKKENWSPKQAKPFSIQEFRYVLSTYGNELRDIRDKAFILTGMIGSFRTGELSNLTLNKLHEYEQGYVVTLTDTKQDPTNKFKKFKVLPKVGGQFCPVAALNAWLEIASIKNKDKNADNIAIFRGINRKGNVMAQALSHTTANRIVHNFANRLGADIGEYSGNSLRSSFITIARALRIPDAIIIRQTLHQDIKTLNIYDRPELAFTDSPATELLNALAGLENN